MNLTALLIGLGVIIVLFVVGKIFAILTKIFIVILLVAALAAGIFIWQNSHNNDKSAYYKIPAQLWLL